MDLTETFETNNADDVLPKQHQKPEDASPLNDDSIINPAYQLGRDIVLAMACRNGAERLKKIKDAKTDTESEKSDDVNHSDPELGSSLSMPELGAKMRSINAEIDSQRAELIGMLVLFDEHKGWESSGAKSCADWGNMHLGITKKNLYEHLRVGRELLNLPTIRGLFRGGELSWSKTKLLTRIADADNERYLANVALDATVSDVKRICSEFRWNKSDAETIDPDTGRSAADLRAEKQFNNRSLVWYEQSDGSVSMRLTLPPEKAQAVLKSMEHCANELYESNDGDVDGDAHSDAISDVDTATKPTAVQRRADAMVLMAERSLQNAGTSVSRSDRYQVVLHIDHSDFVSPTPDSDKPFPTRVPWIEGMGPIADSVASRIACDASVISFLTQDGEPLNIGRQTRTWPANISRAIRARDRHCQFPGCTESRHLDIHHIKHWADYGYTSVENGLCLCSRHHTLVHEGGWIIERNLIDTNAHPGTKDFGATVGLESPAKKALLPTRHRFRFIKPVSPSKSTSNSTSNSSSASSNTSAGGSPQPSSNCCDNHCNESPVGYQVTPRVNKNSGEFVTTWRLADVPVADYRVSRQVSKRQLNKRQAHKNPREIVTTWRQKQRMEQIPPVYH